MHSGCHSKTENAAQQSRFKSKTSTKQYHASKQNDMCAIKSVLGGYYCLKWSACRKLERLHARLNSALLSSDACTCPLLFQKTMYNYNSCPHDTMPPCPLDTMPPCLHPPCLCLHPHAPRHLATPYMPPWPHACMPPCLYPHAPIPPRLPISAIMQPCPPNASCLHAGIPPSLNASWCSCIRVAAYPHASMRLPSCPLALTLYAGIPPCWEGGRDCGPSTPEKIAVKLQSLETFQNGPWMVAVNSWWSLDACSMHRTCRLNQGNAPHHPVLCHASLAF